MDKSRVLYLIHKTYRKDDILQPVAIEEKRRVFCNIQNVTQSEFFEAGRSGLKAEYRAVMFAPDYSGETEVELDGVRYTVYRTYHRRNDDLEVYLQKKVGN